MNCTQCRFDLFDLAVRLPVDSHVAEHGRQITCPLCGQPNNFRPSHHGVFLRETSDGVRRIHVWDLGSGPCTELRVGGMSLVIDTPATIRPEQVAPSSVLSFKRDDGSVVLPQMAVCPEFIDCVDLERMEGEATTVERIDARTAKVTLYLRGVPDRTVSLRRPILANPDDATRDATFEQVNVRMWPPPAKSRKRYIFGLSDAKDGRSVAKGKLRIAPVCADGSRGPYAASRQDGGHVVTGVVHDGLPRWLCVEYFQDKQLVSAGAFRVPRAPVGSSGTVSLGLDFGTSNTCVAFSRDSGPSQLPVIGEREFSFYSVYGGQERRDLDGPAMWPRPKGFGQQRGANGADLLATELWFMDRSQLANRLQDVDSIVFGLDYGLGYIGVTPTATGDTDIRKATVSGFKWQATTAPDLQSHVADLQTLYLWAFLEWASVRICLANDGTEASNMNVVYCMPLAFERASREAFSGAMTRVCEQLSAASGAPWESVCSALDEGRAAAGDIDQNRSEMTVIADMGGGTTDLTVLYHPVKRGARHDLLYNTSFRYAGETLIGAYQSVLLRGDVPGLRRSIREASDLRVLFQRNDLFNSAQQDTRDVRTREFYGYVLDLVARMIAAAVIEGLAVVDDAFDGPIRVRVLPLGNGWGMVGTLGPDSLETVAITVKDRVQALLAATKEAESVVDVKGVSAARVQIAITAEERLDIPHVKAAVAYGLLQNSSAGAPASGSPKVFARSVLGVDTTRNGTTQDRWFASVGPSNRQSVFEARIRRQSSGSGGAADASSPVPAQHESLGAIFAPVGPVAPPIAVGQAVTFSWNGSELQGIVASVQGEDIEVGVRRPMGTTDLPAGSVTVVPDIFTIPGAPAQVGSRVSYASPGRTLMGAVTAVAVANGTLTVSFDEVRVLVKVATVRAGSQASTSPVTPAPAAAPPPSASVQQPGRWLTVVPEGLREDTVFGWGGWNPEVAGTMVHRSRLLLNEAAERELRGVCRLAKQGDWYERSPYELLLEHVVGPGIGRL